MNNALQPGEAFNPYHMFMGLFVPEGLARCRREIAAIKAEILAGNPDLPGLCLALSDWSGELRIIEEELGHRAKKPAAAETGRA